jgi:putative ABC transport system permease protein
VRAPPRPLRALLWLYPTGHRRAYGEEMWEAIRHRFATSVGMSPLRLTAWTAADLTWSAAKMWTRGWGETMKGMTRGWGIDLRFVSRTLRRAPGYALTAVLVLAGAVAVDAAVFSFVRGTLLARPHYPGADRLVVVWGSNPVDGQLRDVVSGPNYIDLRASMRSLEALSAFHSDDAILPIDGRPTVIDVESVSVDFFDIVPVKPLLGRVFEEGDRTSAAPQILVTSWEYWQDALGGDPGVIGRSLPLNGEPHTIVGVLPKGFEFVREVPLWRPLRDDVLAADDRGHIHYHLFGRLRPGATPADATRDLTEGLSAIRERTGQFRGWTMLAEPLHETSVMAVRPVLLSVAAAVTLVLLIALVNLATLFRIRAMSRAEELGVRLALGGGRGRIARVLALEVGGLALIGSTLGLVVAPFLLARVREMVPLWIAIPDSAARVPVLRAVLDPQVALLSLGLAVLGALALAAPSDRGESPGRGGVGWPGGDPSRHALAGRRRARPRHRPVCRGGAHYAERRAHALNGRRPGGRGAPRALLR